MRRKALAYIHVVLGLAAVGIATDTLRGRVPLRPKTAPVPVETWGLTGRYPLLWIRLRGGSDFSGEDLDEDGMVGAAKAFDMRSSRYAERDERIDSSDGGDENQDIVLDVGEHFPKLKGMGINLTIPGGNATDESIQAAAMSALTSVKMKLEAMPPQQLIQLARRAAGAGILNETFAEDEQMRKLASDVIDGKYNHLFDDDDAAKVLYSPAARGRLFGEDASPARATGGEPGVIKVPHMIRNFPDACGHNPLPPLSAPPPMLGCSFSRSRQP
jgi:hypothetical protein